MRSQVTVSWGEPATYRFDLEEVQPLPHDLARSWLDEQFTFLGCDPIRPTGKVLTADKILCVAEAAGEQRFRDAAHRPWAMAFARAASAALAKPVVSIDVPKQSLTY
ncbi:hypothetical protein [Hydrogenophaga sp.]|jgi:hypothetical protein|uniref:hypothetical protein n=1 Tax=Hydrogenophaga sp. TaxID=1904254 RepID=UPI000EE283DF|nr:hypothetical protein [Hydrogenophaga sp.]RJP67278.1 MAG: hypothetical protein C4535_11390 [Comamonadaceae bacterium]